ncbi:MAG: peroxiredoxin-like family protein, partial [bacterium]|nr:peroxiredoxin-like family protein [bacterium]
ASAEEICPLLVGQKIPIVTLKTHDGANFDLNAAVTQKPTVLIFYRGGWCPYCNLHLAELQKIESDLLKLGYQIIAISVDRFEKLPPTMEKQQLNYTLLADNQARATQAFGLAYKVSDADFQRLQGFGMDLEEASGQKHHILPVPAALVVGTDGIIKFSYINPNYKARVKADILLAAAKAELKSNEK